MIDINNLGDKLLLPLEDGFTEVYIYNDNKSLKKGYGYIYEGLVYIFKGNVTDKDNLKESGLYRYKNKEKNITELVFLENDKPDMKNTFPLESIVDLSPSAILKSVVSSPDEFISSEDLESLAIDRDVYTPLIKESDDFLKVGIKKAIIGKNVNVKKKYKDVFGSQSRLSNMISSLKGESKMSTSYWTDWANVLGLKWELKIYDDGSDDRNPLHNDITLSSDDF